MRQAIVVLLFAAATLCCGNELKNETGPQSAGVNLREARSRTADYLDIMKCAGNWDSACVLDKAEEILLESHQRFMVEADNEVSLSGRAKNEDESPSALIESISSIFSEISELFFKNGITGMFRDGKEDDGEEGGEVEDETEEDEDEVDEQTKKADKKDDKGRGLNGVARGKKKKKLKAIIKLLILGVVLFGKITLLLKILAAHLQIKFLLIAAAGLLINGARFYLDLKKGHAPQKVIYYEHAQHQHHYDGSEDDWSGGGGGGHGGYWGRSYETLEEKKAAAQELAYSQQKPSAGGYVKQEDGTNFSWLG